MRYGPDGIHFFDRQSGLNVLLDEAVIPHERWSVAPRQVSIALTNVCDLACPYCYAPKSRDRLNAEVVKGWLHELDQLGTFGVGFGGGEPLLHPQFLDLCQFGSEQTGLAITCTTHGHHLTQQLAQELRGHIHFMRLSMDGTGPTYERLRRRPFLAFLEKLELAQTICPVGLNFVVNAETIQDLDHAVELAQQFGVREFLLLPEQGVNGRPGIAAAILEELQQWVSMYAGQVRLAISASEAEGFPVCYPLVHETPLIAFAHINARGELLACSYSKHGIIIGEKSLKCAFDALLGVGVDI